MKGRRKKGFWQDTQNQRKFMDELYEKLSFKSANDWSKLKWTDVKKNGGKYLLDMYNGNLNQALKEIYPEKQFNFEERKKPKYFWESIENQRKFMTELFQKLRLSSNDDWKYVKKRHFIENKGTNLIKYYDGDLSALLSAIYPDISFDLSKNTGKKSLEYRIEFSCLKKQKRQWKSIENQRKWMEEASLLLKINTLDDWTKISKSTIRSISGGRRLLNLYNSDKYLMFSTIYSDHQWSFNIKKSRNYWSLIEHQLTFINNLYYKLNLSSIDDWKNVKMNTIINNGGKGLLSYYSYDLHSLLTAIYPDHLWIHSNSDSISSKLLELQKYYSIARKEDWYRIELDAHRSLFKYLSVVHPDQQWEKFNFILRSKKATQRTLCCFVRSLFPKLLILEGYWYALVNNNFEFDVFIPAINYAIEYQGIHHYEDSPNVGFGHFELYQKRDERKLALSKQASINIATIPYWWDCTFSTLAVTLRNSFQSHLHSIQ